MTSGTARGFTREVASSKMNHKTAGNGKEVRL